MGIAAGTDLSASDAATWTPHISDHLSITIAEKVAGKSASVDSIVIAANTQAILDLLAGAACAPAQIVTDKVTNYRDENSSFD